MKDELTEKRLDVIIESEFQQCELDAGAIMAEGVARHGAERLKRELIRLGFVCAPVEPVPAPRLEWREETRKGNKSLRARDGAFVVKTLDDERALVTVSKNWWGKTAEECQAVAESLAAVLAAPPVGPTPDDVKMEEAMDDFARNTTPGGTWIFEDESGEPE